MIACYPFSPRFVYGGKSVYAARLDVHCEDPNGCLSTEYYVNS